MDEMALYAQDWLLDCEARNHSPRTIQLRTIVTDRQHWYCAHKCFKQCGPREFKQFFIYLQKGHEEHDKDDKDCLKRRRGKTRATYLKPMAPRTIKTYWGDLHAWFAWLVGEKVLDVSPLDSLGAPIARSDQIKLFTQDEIRALLQAASRSRNAARDMAIIWFLLDTGARASEVCSLKHGDIDLKQRRVVVLGKGGKRRTLIFGRNVTQTLNRYGVGDPNEPLFTAGANGYAGEGLTRGGLLQIIQRLGRAAGITNARCSPTPFAIPLPLNS